MSSNITKPRFNSCLYRKPATGKNPTHTTPGSDAFHTLSIPGVTRLQYGCDAALRLTRNQG